MEASIAPRIIFDSELSGRCIAQGRHARNFERLGRRNEDEEDEDGDTISSHLGWETTRAGSKLRQGCVVRTCNCYLKTERSE